MNLLLQKVKRLVIDAAALIREENREDTQVHCKGRADFVTWADLRISEFLIEKLQELLPGFPVISEEGAGMSVSPNGDCWIIDPIDGTTNFIYGLPFYAVSVGLVRDMRPVLGVVYNPASGELFSAALGLGAWLGNRPIRVNSDAAMSDSLILAETDPYMDRTLNASPKLIEAIFRRCLDYRVTGSAALDICFIAAGRGGAFFAQTLKPWDYTAAGAILLEAGGRITRWDGSPLLFRDKQSILASNVRLHAEMLDQINTLR